MVDAMAEITITIWPGCDPGIASAIKSFSRKLGPYSGESRRRSIFSLLRDLIDPAWNDLCHRFPSISRHRLDHVWVRYQWERFRSLGPEDGGTESRDLKVARVERSFIPCGGKGSDGYVLSSLARRHGFNVLDRFIQLMCQSECVGADTQLARSLDSLRELALVCRAKKPKRTNGGEINARRYRVACRLCGQKTEVSAYLDEDVPWPEDDIQHVDERKRLRLSSLYCSVHKPKTLGNPEVSATYRTLKRNQERFDREYLRLERQSFGWDVVMPQARSGNKLVDEFMVQLIEVRKLGVGDGDASDSFEIVERRLRDEARRLVDRKISDRKKEIVMLLATGHSQSSAALCLGVRRQAVSKAIQSVPLEYRFDLLGERE
jgi:predicted transcriptional regulator